MEQQFQNTSSVDYSLKDGETLVLQIKSNVMHLNFLVYCVIWLRFAIILTQIFSGLGVKQKCGQSVKSKFFEQGVNDSSPENKGNQKELKISIKPPPPPPAPLSPVSPVQNSPSNSPTKFELEGTSKHEAQESRKNDSKDADFSETHSTQDVPDDVFGDFQAAG